MLIAIAALALMATSNAFAFSTVNDTQSSTANNGPLDEIGAISAVTLNVGSAETVVASFSYASFQTSTTGGSLPAGTAPGAASPIRIMYQQWRQVNQNDWFYLYAVNSNTAASAGAPVWDYYYYTPARGATRFAASSANNVVASTGAGISGGTLGSAPAGLSSSAQIFLTAGNNWPAFQLISATANSAPCGFALGGRCGASLSSTLWWGVAQQGFGSGSMAVQEAVESFPLRDATTNSLVIYYDAWKSVLGPTSTQNISLNDAAPVQAATSTAFTNASGARNVNTASGYDSIQTITDAEGDLQSQSAIWVATAPPAGSSVGQTGQWFQAGVYYGRTTGGYSLDGNATAFYQSWNEPVMYTTVGSQLTTNYLQSLRVNVCTTAACTSNGVTRVDRGNGQLVVPTGWVDYTYIYQPLARGTWNLYGRGEDWHGRTSGNVLVGSQVIS